MITAVWIVHTIWITGIKLNQNISKYPYKKYGINFKFASGNNGQNAENADK